MVIDRGEGINRRGGALLVRSMHDLDVFLSFFLSWPLGFSTGMAGWLAGRLTWLSDWPSESGWPGVSSRVHVHMHMHIR